MESLQVQEPSNKRVYTIEEIDGHLEFLANLAKFGRANNRSYCFTKANEWLDERLKICQPQQEQNH